MEMFKSRKGFTIGDIPWLVITFGVGVIVASIVGQIVGDVKATQTAASIEANISNAGQQGIVKIANWFTTIGLVIGAVIVITALGALFMFKKNQ